MTQIHLGHVRYDTVTRAYEAPVTILRDGAIRQIPSRISAPVNANPARVARALTAQALKRFSR